MTEILIRAGGENGHIVTGSKAALIVKSGGQVTVCGVDDHDTNIWGMWSRVYGETLVQNGPESWSVRPPEVSSSALGRMSSQDAALKARVIAAAAELAAKAQSGTVNWFDHRPGWVSGELAGQEWSKTGVAVAAAERYHLGDVDLTDAWRYAVEMAKSGQEQGDDRSEH